MLCCVLCFGSLAQGELWKCSFCVRHLLALQALFLLRLRLPFSWKLLWKFRFLGLLLLLLPSLYVGRGRGGGSGVHLVFFLGASSPPARLWSGERGGSASGLLSVACGLAPSSPPPSGGGGAGVGSLAADALFPASPRLLTLPNSHRTFHDVGIWGSLQSLAPAFYPPASPALRSVARGWIRGLGPVRLALVDVAVALALSPLTVRGLAVVSVGDGRRPLHALLVDAHAVSGRGLLTAATLSVGALGRVVPGLDPRIDIGHAVTSLGVRGRGLLPAAAPTVSVRVFPACRGVRRVRSRSHALPNRSLDRSRSCVRLPASPARLRAVEAGRLARRGPQEGVGAFVSQPPVAWCSGGRPSCSGGASIAALPSVFSRSLPGSS